jgi:HAD superfamily hydrolase (TIGR01509 family)
VLFDIDGTLVDSNYLHVEAWSRAFSEVQTPVDDWRIHRCIGMDGSKLLETLLGEDENNVGDEARELHSRYYLGMRSRLRPFASARDLLAAVADRGVKVVLATSAPEDELAALRETLKVENTVAEITSSGDVETAKPDPDILLVAMEKAESAASGTVMVGDSIWDMVASTRAGVTCIGVLTGGFSESELRDAGALAVYDDVAALLEQLEDSPLARLWQ